LGFVASNYLKGIESLFRVVMASLILFYLSGILKYSFLGFYLKHVICLRSHYFFFVIVSGFMLIEDPLRYEKEAIGSSNEVAMGKGKFKGIFLNF